MREKLDLHNEGRNKVVAALMFNEHPIYVQIKKDVASILMIPQEEEVSSNLPMNRFALEVGNKEWYISLGQRLSSTQQEQPYDRSTTMSALELSNAMSG